MGADFPVLPRISPTRGAGEVRNPELEEIKDRIALNSKGPRRTTLG
jgi:hypothetical protein